MRQQQAYYTKKAIRTQKIFPKGKKWRKSINDGNNNKHLCFFQNSFHSYIFVCLESDPQKNLEKFEHIFLVQALFNKVNGS